MKRWILVWAVAVGSVALANGRPDCMRNCVNAQKNFEKQCKETAAGDPDSKAGCDMVAKKADQMCRQACATGTKPKKPTNTSSF